MTLRRALCLLLCLYGACGAMTASAAPPVEAGKSVTSLDQRIDQIIPLLLGTIAPEDFFDPVFLSKVASSAQMKAFAQNVLATFGTPQKILRISKVSANTATLEIAFEKGVTVVDVTVAAGEPNQVTAFYIVPAQPVVLDDSLTKIDAELAALPGRVGYVIESITPDGKRSRVAGRATIEQFAIGSIFKLYILAELASQIDAGKRKWSDTVPLTQRSFSSQATQGIALGTPVTLEQLATWMIAVSDNAATDELLFLLGRDRVEARVRKVGHSDPNKTLPFLSTVEAFLLKSDYKGTRAKYVGESKAKQRAILKKSISGVGFDKINLANFTAKPASIDTIEWFASPEDVMRLLDHLRLMNNKTALDIMARSVAPATAKSWRYIGSKGGSELGVIAMSFLAQAPSGMWTLVSGSWNDTEQAVDETRFMRLMLRLLSAVAE
jgi:beta-lactamase class A